MPEFLLPFRKPKRIRTAFSPSQLLKLEQAFEKNQYVVGQERKELAKSLNLSETQVNHHYKQLINYHQFYIKILSATVKLGVSMPHGVLMMLERGQKMLIMQLIKFCFIILCI